MNDLERVLKSYEQQKATGIRLNAGSALQIKIMADGFTPVMNEETDPDNGIVYRGAEHERTSERRLYQWLSGQPVWWIPGRPEDYTDPPIDPPPKDEFKAKIGLHASANGGRYNERDYGEFADLEPSIIKVTTNHDEDSIRRLADEHPNVSWVVRVFYSTGGRAISPQKFFEETISDTERTLRAIGSGRVVVELHNEPNLVSEGLFMGKWRAPIGDPKAGWCGGDQFNDWYLDLLHMYRSAMPGTKFIFPGLSPGPTEPGIRASSWRFAEECKEAIYASDGLGIHTYWAGDEMAKAMSVVDWYRGNFPKADIWVTEASNNQPNLWFVKAQQYADFWKMLKMRSRVKGITYFVVSGAYQEEVWAGNSVGRMTRAAI